MENIVHSNLWIPEGSLKCGEERRAEEKSSSDCVVQDLTQLKAQKRRANRESGICL